MTTRRAAGPWPAATLVIVGLGVVFLGYQAAAGRLGPADAADPLPWLSTLASVVAYGVAGAVLLDRRPDLPFGWLLAGTAVLVVAQALVVVPSYEAIMRGESGALPRWGFAVSALGFLPIAVQGLINVRFPSGRPASRGGRVLEIALIAGTALVVLGGFLGADLAGFRHPLTDGTVIGTVADALLVLAPVVVLLGLVAGLGVVLRFFRATGVERQQLKWRAAGVLAALVLFPLAVTDGIGYLNVLDPLLFVLTLAIPVLRYKLWAIDTILRRSLVYGCVLGTLAVAYVAVSALVVRVAPDGIAAAVAAAVVALSFGPLRRRLQQLFYGDRHDPYRTLRELGRRINDGSPGGVLNSVVEAVATSLRLPHVAIERYDSVPLAAHGASGARTERWALAYEGQVEGYLVASPRRGEDGFDDRDREVLGDVAGQLGVAVHAETLTAEVLMSRQRLVSAREEERRRLRRDLHDGLGPVLTAVGLHLDAVRSRLTTAPATAGRHLGEAKEATVQALTELRRLVHGLRPPALDDLGLLGALRGQADRLRAGSGLVVTIEADDLPDLPAAVEVAVFRIAVEAITNTVRHSTADRCRVRLAATSRELTLTVHDDGCSSGPWVPGVGLAAMRERAAEVGGSVKAGPDEAGHATVTAAFPLVAGS